MTTFTLFDAIMLGSIISLFAACIFHRVSSIHNAEQAAKPKRREASHTPPEKRREASCEQPDYLMRQAQAIARASGNDRWADEMGKSMVSSRKPKGMDRPGAR